MTTPESLAEVCERELKKYMDGQDIVGEFNLRHQDTLDQAWTAGWDAGIKAHKEMVSGLVEALEKISRIQAPDWTVEGENFNNVSVGSFAREALSNYVARMKE